MSSELQLLNAVSAFFGSLVAAGIVAYFTQQWIERRERRKKRDELRLELYLEVVDLVLDNELEIAERGTEGRNPPVPLQLKRLRISHRLKLLGSELVKITYKEYSRLVYQETAQPIQYRSPNPDEVVHARDALIGAMAKDVQEEQVSMNGGKQNEVQSQSGTDWLAFYLHQDNLQWNRLQTLGTVQIAAIASAYAIRDDKPTAISAIVLGILLSALVFAMFNRDERWRFTVEKKCDLVTDVPRHWSAPLKGREIAWCVFGLLLAADIYILWLI